MTTRTMIVPARRRTVGVASLSVTFALAVLLAPAPLLAQGGGADAGDAETVVRSFDSLRRVPAATTSSFRGRTARPMSNTLLTPNDSFLVVSHGFDDANGTCNPRGWTGQDLTQRVFAHVSSRFTVNDGFVNMGTRALWFGADSSSALDEISQWVRPYGYGNGWSQRLTSPLFSLAAHPTSLLRFDVSMQLRRGDGAPTSNFTPYGLASGKVGNDMIAVQAKLTNGTWANLTTRPWSPSLPPWSQLAPLYENRVTGAQQANPTNLLVPNGIAVDDSGYVYVADRGNNRVMKFTKSGNLVRTWGVAGAGPGQFSSPFDVCVDHVFHVFVTDAQMRVQRFDSNGNFQLQWGSSGAGIGQFNFPFGICADAANDIYVCDQANHRIQKFSNAGVPILQWGTFGGNFGQFNSPSQIVCDGPFVYVTDTGNNRVQKFNGAGAFLTMWGSPGSGDGQFNAPSGIGVDRFGFVWVTDRANHRIQRFTGGGTFLLKTGSQSTAAGHFFDTPRDIAISRANDLYVVESGNNRFQTFSLGGPIAGEGTFKLDAGLRADGNEDLPLADPAQVRIVMQSSSRLSSEDGQLFPGQDGVILVDNVQLLDSLGSVLPTVDFEGSTTGAWTLSALNNGYLGGFTFASSISDFPAPATSVALRKNFDLYDPTCVWTFLSPGDSLANGAYARLVSPWIALTPGDSIFHVRVTTRLNTLLQSRFVYPYVRGKNAGDTRVRAYDTPAFVVGGNNVALEASEPLEPNAVIFDFPSNADAGTAAPVKPVGCDSIQIVFEVLDQADRNLGTPPQARPTAHLPIFDDIEVVQVGVDSDYDGVADAFDACDSTCAAGQDRDGDGCVDATATMHHVESWRGEIHYTLHDTFSAAEQAAIRAGISTWQAVDGVDLPISEDAMTPLANADALDGINLVTASDPDVQFPPGVLAITPTTSFTQRAAFHDRVVLPGEIVDSDMILNPAALFTTSGEPGKHDLQSVVTHEAGHMIGLTHTGVLDATMFFVIQPGELARTLSPDDESAVAAAYPAPNLATAYGTITGTIIRGQTGNPLPGALVEAVRLGAGNVLADTTASDYSDELGGYALRRLPPGNYAVRITPLDGNVGGFPLTPDYISQRLASITHDTFVPEWWSAPESDRDDPALRTPIAISAGQTLANINITTTVDTIPPSVTSTLPGDGASGVAIDTPILVNFSEPVVPATLEASFRLRKNGLPPSIGGTGQLRNGTSFVFTPDRALEFNSSYEIEISPALTDVEGVALADTFRAVFGTQDQPPLSITDIQPRSAPVGGLITITGTGFNPESTLVVFPCSNCVIQGLGIQASQVTPTSLVIRVPGSAFTGQVYVFTERGSSNPFAFTVLPPAPQSAPVPSGAPVSVAPLTPTDVAVSPDGSTAYVVGVGGISTIDLAQPGRPVTPRLAGTMRGLALTPDGTRLVTCDISQHKLVVMGAVPGNNIGIIIGNVVLPSPNLGDIAISPDGRRAYVPQVGDPIVDEIDIDPQSGSALTLLRQLFLGTALANGGVTASPDGAQLYVSTSNLGVVSATLANPPVVTPLYPVQTTQGSLATTPSGSEVLAAAANNAVGVVAVQIPISGPFVPFQLPINGVIRDVGIAPEGQSAYVVSSTTNELHVLNVDQGTATYHAIVSTVGTGPSPVSVGVSSLSSVLAVANAGDRTITIFTAAGGDGGLARVVPDVAIAGDAVAVHSSNSFYPSGTTVDLGDGNFPTTNAVGTAAAFVVPPSPQRATTLTLENPSHVRSLALPFTVVDPISTFVPRPGGMQAVINPVNCFDPTAEDGLVFRMRTSPDDRIIAAARHLAGGCDLIDFIAARMQGDGLPGYSEGFFDSSIIPVSDLVFSPDSKHLWVVRAGDAGVIIDTDPASPTFGQSVNDFVRGVVGHFPQGVAADPLNRYMVVSNSDPSGGTTLCLYDATTAALVDTFQVGFTFSNAVVSRDGRYAVLGTANGIRLFDLTTKALMPLPLQSPGITGVTELVTTTNGKRAVGLLSGSNIAVWNLDPTAGPVGTNLYFGHPIGSNLSHIVEGADGHSVIAGCADCNTLTRLDVSTVPPGVTSADIGQPLTAVTRSPDGRRLWGVNSALNGNGQQRSGLPKMWSFADAATLSLISGGGQSVPPSTTLPVPIRVRVTGANGRPQAGVFVHFRINGGEMEGVVGIFDNNKITDANGEAQVTWSLAAGGSPLMTIDVPGGPAAPLTVTATIAANDADIIPDVTQFGPLDGATNVNAGSAVFVRFNQRMNPATLPQFMHLTSGGTTSVPGAFSFQDGGAFVVFQPATPLAFTSACTLFVEPGASDLDGQLTTTRRFAAFTVQSPPTLTATSLQPAAGPAGAQVVIAGQGFSTVASSNVVTFSGTLAPVQRATLTALTTGVPAAATSGPVVVQLGPSSTTGLDFTVLSPNANPGQILGDVPDNDGLSRIAFTPDGARAYVTNTTHNSVTVIDVAAAEVVTSITVGLGPRGIAILPNGKRAYVANHGSGNVSVIDTDPASPTYNKVVNTIRVGDEPVDVCVSGLGPKVFVANSKSGTVSIIDANPGNATFDQVVTTVNTGTGSGAVVVSPDGGRLYVGTATSVVMVDLGSLVVTTVNTGSGAGAVAISPDGTIVIALLYNGNLVVIDATPGSPNFNKVVTTVNTGSGSGAVSVSPDGGLAYVTSPDGNVVKVYEIIRTNTQGASSFVPGPSITLTLVQTFPVGQAPADIALSPTGSGLALVPNAGSGTITFIGVPPPPNEVTMGFDFNPNALNLKSLGQWTKGTLTPPAPYTASDIVVSSVRINGVVAVDPRAPVTITSGGGLELRFSRAALQLILPEGDAVPVTVTGTIAGHPFTGTDHIQVKSNKVNSPHAAEIVNADAPYTVRWTTPKGVNAQWVALLHSLDHGANWTLDATHLPNTGQASWSPPFTVRDSVKVAVVVVESAADGDTLVTGLVGVSDYFRLTTPTAVEPLPMRLEFSRITPSPSRGTVRMRYGLPRAADVDLELYDVQGRRLCTLVSGAQEAGWHEAFWDGRGDGGAPVGSGLYFVRFRAEGHVFRQRMIWIR
jgi:YVTN family beta-propeller protein